MTTIRYDNDPIVFLNLFRNALIHKEFYMASIYAKKLDELIPGETYTQELEQIINSETKKSIKK